MTKFKNRDLLISSLEECVKFRYHISLMVHMQYLITKRNFTFEQAFCLCMNQRNEVYHTVSSTYHRMIRDLNIDKFNKKERN